MQVVIVRGAGLRVREKIAVCAGLVVAVILAMLQAPSLASSGPTTSFFSLAKKQWYHPTWSPDERYVAGVGVDGVLWVYDVRARTVRALTPRRTTSGLVHWLRDSSAVVAVVAESARRGATQQIQAVGLDGRSRVLSANLAEEPGNDSSSAFAMTSDDAELAFTSCAPNLTGLEDGGCAILLRNSATGVIDLLDVTEDQLQYMKWSKSGRWLAYGGNYEPLRVYDNVLKTTRRIPGDEFLAWSPSKADEYAVLRTTGMVGRGAFRTERFQLQVRSMTTQNTMCVSCTKKRKQANWLSLQDQHDSTAEWAGWSPNGRFVVFQSAATNLSNRDRDNLGVGKGGVADLYMKDLRTGELMFLTPDRKHRGSKDAPGESQQPAWSPDGRSIAFASWNERLVRRDSNGRLSDVFVRGVGSTASPRLASLDARGRQSPYGSCDGPRWSPSGKWLLMECDGVPKLKHWPSK